MTTALFPTSRTLRNIHDSKEFAQHAAIRGYLTALSGIAAFILLCSVAAALLPESMKTAPFRGIEQIMTFGEKISIFSPPQAVALQNVAWNETKIPVPVTTDLQSELPAIQPEQPQTPGGAENGSGTVVTNPNGNPAQNGGTTTPVTVEPTSEVPPNDTFEVYEKDPVVDLAMLQKLIVYPEIAHRAGIEGTVYISVYIGADGRAKQTRIDRSPSDLLNSAAVQAIMKATFVSAVQDNRSVGCWVSIPITFKLR